MLRVAFVLRSTEVMPVFFDLWIPLSFLSFLSFSSFFFPFPFYLFLFLFFFSSFSFFSFSLLRFIQLQLEPVKVGFQKKGWPPNQRGFVIKWGREGKGEFLLRPAFSRHLRRGYFGIRFFDPFFLKLALAGFSGKGLGSKQKGGRF